MVKVKATLVGDYPISHKVELKLMSTAGISIEESVTLVLRASMSTGVHIASSSDIVS